MVDREKAKRLVSELLNALSDLKRYRERITAKQLRDDRDTQHMVLHALYVGTQAAVDLAMHVGADAGLPQASSYQESFRRLAEAGRLDRDLADRLAAWAGFRNVLAHFYASVDYDRVFRALSELEDLERFAALMTSEIGPG
jgi:uncharacterized protein YutE (UPF0331/DUF86 family)